MDHLDAAAVHERQRQRAQIQVRTHEQARDLAIAAAYEEDRQPTTVIAARLRVSPQTVNKRLQALGVVLRPRGPEPGRGIAPGGGSGGDDDAG